MLFIGNYLFIFYFGAVFGSFFTVLGTRIPIKEVFTFSRSHCVHCNHALASRDLFPIFSYLFRFGKCAYCNRKIDSMYVVVESLSGLTACLLYYFYSNEPLYLLAYAGIFSILAIISITDYLYLLVPDRFQICLLSAAIFLHSNLSLSDWKASAISFAAIFALLLFTLFVVPDGLGGGDIKLLSILAFAFGLRQSLLILSVSSLSACLFLTAGSFFNKKTFAQRLPFVPFIANATLLVHFLRLFYFR